MSHVWSLCEVHPVPRKDDRWDKKHVTYDEVLVMEVLGS